MYTGEYFWSDVNSKHKSKQVAYFAISLYGGKFQPHLFGIKRRLIIWIHAYILIGQFTNEKRLYAPRLTFV